jgi:multidrug efflux pump subunit AcrA (membrane-fusion protein)
MSNAIDVASRSMLVQLQADNVEGKLFGGAYSQVHFLLTGPNAVRVPATALVSFNQGTQVAVVGKDNTVTLKSVQLGRDFGDTVEIVSGLSPLDRVIDSPPEALQGGDVVQVATATPPPNSARDVTSQQ